jgi:hypothetical protein
MSIGEKKERLGKIILERSFKYSDNPPFTLASGRQSNYYFNCKPTTLDPEGMNLIGEVVFDMLQDAPVTAAGGLTLGADPIANALAVVSWQKGRPIKSFIVRKDVKDHGTKSAVEGNVAAGAGHHFDRPGRRRPGKHPRAGRPGAVRFYTNRNHGAQGKTRERPVAGKRQSAVPCGVACRRLCRRAGVGASVISKSASGGRNVRPPEV